MGSRANGRATPASDWDLVVFGSPEYLKAAKQLALPTNPKADVLVVTDGDSWVGLDTTKRGTLKAWKWRKTADQARYEGTKFEKDEESSRQFGADMGNVIVRKERALKVWPTK
jgi:predicted nucleotidyltransferase